MGEAVSLYTDLWCARTCCSFSAFHDAGEGVAQASLYDRAGGGAKASMAIRGPWGPKVWAARSRWAMRGGGAVGPGRGAEACAAGDPGAEAKAPGVMAHGGGLSSAAVADDVWWWSRVAAPAPRKARAWMKARRGERRPRRCAVGAGEPGLWPGRCGAGGGDGGRGYALTVTRRR